MINNNVSRPVPLQYRLVNPLVSLVTQHPFGPCIRAPHESIRGSTRGSTAIRIPLEDNSRSEGSRLINGRRPRLHQETKRVGVHASSEQLTIEDLCDRLLCWRKRHGRRGLHCFFAVEKLVEEPDGLLRAARFVLLVQGPNRNGCTRFAVRGRSRRICSAGS